MGFCEHLDLRLHEFYYDKNHTLSLFSLRCHCLSHGSSLEETWL